MSTHTQGLVSIIIPAYNSEKFIIDAVNSAINQTWGEKEIIVVDDGSTDSTRSLLEEYSDEIILITQENNGVSAARNNAVNMAAGHWVAFLDSDDIWHPEKIERQITHLGEYKWSHTNSKYIGENIPEDLYRSDLTTMHYGDIFSKIITTNFITTSTVLMERAIYIQFGGLDESLEALEDWLLWTMIAKEHSIAYLAEPLTDYRVYAGSTSRKSRIILPLHLEVIDIIYDEIVDDIVLQGDRENTIFNSYNTCAFIAEEANDYYFALKCTFNSFLIRPTNLKSWRSLARIIVKILFFTLKNLLSITR